MIRRLVIAFGLLLACSAPAWAKPQFVQSVVPTTCCTVSFPQAPANGDIVVWQVRGFSDLAASTVTDSNGVSYTLESYSNAKNCSNGLCEATFDHVVTGSPTATYTFTGAITTYAAGAEISGATLSGATYNATAAAAGPVSVILSPSAGSAQDCYSTSLGASTAVTLTNESSYYSQAQAALALAATTASSTCTQGISGSVAAMVFASYPPVPNAISVVQTKDCGAVAGSGTCTLTSAPSNDMLFEVNDKYGVNTNFKDSNGVVGTVIVASPSVATAAAIDYWPSITNSPTAVYTNTTTSATLAGFLEVRGADPHSVLSNNLYNANTVNTVTVTGTLPAGGILVCAVNSGDSSATVTSSVPGLTQFQNDSGLGGTTNGNYGYYAIATSAVVNPSCTGTQSPSNYMSVAVAIVPPAPYPAPNAYPYPSPFQPAFYRGDPIFEMLAIN